MTSPDMLTPRRWRAWFGAPPCVGRRNIQAQWERLCGDFPGRLSYPLSI